MLERGFILSPGAADMVAHYYSAVEALGAWDRAERIFAEASALYPGDRRIAFLLIDILIKQGKHAEAMTGIEEAMIIFGTDDGILAAALDVRRQVGLHNGNRPAGTKPAITLCMIVKNEEQYLARCLMSVKPVVEEMIVVDTGSKDRTKEIAEAFGAKVIDFPWTGVFAEARNFSLSNASGDWMLIMDADEMISPVDHQRLRDMTGKRGRGAAWSFVTRNYIVPVYTMGWTANDGRYSREEAGTGWFPSVKVRLFPNDRRIRFVNPVHEMLEPSLLKAGVPIKDSNVPIHHYGKLDQNKDIVKGETYYELGKKKLEETGENPAALRELAIQAGGLKKFDEAVDLWQRAIRVKPDMTVAHLNLRSIFIELGRYQDALQASSKALELDPKMKEAAYNAAFCMLYTGDADSAVALLDDLVRREPDYPSARVLHAMACCCAGRNGKGLELLSKLNRMNFNFFEPLHKFVRKLASAGRHEYAVRLIDAAAETGNVNDELIAFREECNGRNVRA